MAGTPLEVLDSAGNPDILAGSHPDRLVTKLAAPETGGVTETTRDLIIDFPPGMGGDSASVPVCTRRTFDSIGGFEAPPCPAESMVGALVIVREEKTEKLPVYSLEPAPGEVAAFGLGIATLRLKFSGHLRATDFGLSMRLEGLPQEQPEEGGKTLESYFEFWGVPADHQGEIILKEGETPAEAAARPRPPRGPFLTLPTKCGAPLEMSVRERTWERSGEWRGSTVSTGLPLIGCQNLPFAPQVGLQLESPVADTPTGVDLDLTFPQNNDPDGLASSQVRNARLQLPAGVGLSLGAAARITACTDAQLRLGSEAPATCPSSAKVGTTEFEAPQLSRPLVGNVYLGEEHPGDRFRVFVVVGSGEFEGKFVGTMSADPLTGRLTTTLSEMPQIPLSALRMHFDGGPRALLVAPSRCGPATVDRHRHPLQRHRPGELLRQRRRRCPSRAPVRYPGPVRTLTGSGDVGPLGGHATSFSAVIGRRDGEQSTERFSSPFPSGISAALGLGHALLRRRRRGRFMSRPPARSAAPSSTSARAPQTAELEGERLPHRPLQ